MLGPTCDIISKFDIKKTLVLHMMSLRISISLQIIESRPKAFAWTTSDAIFLLPVPVKSMLNVQGLNLWGNFERSFFI